MESDEKMTWKKVFNKKHDTKITINLRNELKIMYQGKKVDYDRLLYKVVPDYENNRFIVSVKQGIKKEEGETQHEEEQQA